MVAAGCGSPSYGDCAFTCAQSGECPGELSCVEGMCRAAGAVAECGVADAAAVGPDSGDAPVDGATFCGGWTYEPSNVDACALEAVGGWTPAPGSWFYETDTDHLYGPAGQPAEVPFARAVVAGGTVRLIALDSLTIESGILVRFSGALPVVIAVDGPVTIDGRLSVAGDSSGNPGAGAASADCFAGAASAGDDSETFGEGGGGGGGGGFGLGGGDGGGSADDATTGGEGGQPHGEEALTPLRAGCPGAPGGVSFGGDEGGAGGPAGGALQVSSSAALSISASATIEAGGGGGAAGEGDSSSGGGGGGGGSGGAVLLEGLTIVMDGQVCAQGGGGGGGYDDGQGQVGGDGPCVPFNQGGDPNGGDGGAFGTTANGNDGNNDGGGGGGGGSVGRIRVRITSGAALGGAGIFVPAPTTAN